MIAAMRLLVSFDRLSIEDRKLRAPSTPRPSSPPPRPSLNDAERAQAMELASTLMALREHNDNPSGASELMLSSTPAGEIPLTAFGLGSTVALDADFASLSSPSRRERNRSKGRPKR